MAKILLVEDDKNLLKILSFYLSEEGFEVEVANNGEDAFSKATTQNFDILITDVKMPKMNGIELLKEIKKVNPETAVIVMTAYGSIEDAVIAIKEGAEDYLTKPISKETLLLSVEKAYKIKEIKSQNQQLKERFKEESALKTIVYRSKKMADFIDSLKSVAKSESSILLTGESGTGKEVAAKAIHQLSDRRNGQFVAINCSSIPKELLESELFGYEKGAFSGAYTSNKGKIQIANGGTLFLDEIGDMDLSLQAKILRVLETKIVEPLGAREPKKVDFRLICATNKDLKKMVDGGLFRNDLYYRISVIPLEIPPLRDRKEDIPLLLKHFYKMFSSEEIKIDEEALEILLNYRWNGNVRELKNLCERWAILKRGEKITIKSLPQEILFNSFEENYKGSLWEIEKRVIEETLKKNGGNITKSANDLKIPRHILIYRMKKWGIKGSPF